MKSFKTRWSKRKVKIAEAKTVEPKEKETKVRTTSIKTKLRKHSSSSAENRRPSQADIELDLLNEMLNFSPDEELGAPTAEQMTKREWEEFLKDKSVLLPLKQRTPSEGGRQDIVKETARLVRRNKLKSVLPESMWKDVEERLENELAVVSTEEEICSDADIYDLAGDFQTFKLAFLRAHEE